VPKLCDAYINPMENYPVTL